MQPLSMAGDPQDQELNVPGAPGPCACPLLSPGREQSCTHPSKGTKSIQRSSYNTPSRHRGLSLLPTKGLRAHPGAQHTQPGWGHSSGPPGELCTFRAAPAASPQPSSVGQAPRAELLQGLSGTWLPPGASRPLARAALPSHVHRCDLLMQLALDTSIC